jgi:hypothetical protein
MAADPLDTLRLKLMQDLLPVGMAAVQRVRTGGPGELMSIFDGRHPDPMDQLRQEGEQAAGEVREQLDRVSPGLGNPVMKVTVEDLEMHDAPLNLQKTPPPPPPPRPSHAVSSSEDLRRRLSAIQVRLRALERRLIPTKPTT